MLRAAFPSGRKSLLLFALAAVIVGGVWWWQRPPPEPVYNGERLSEFLAANNHQEGFALLTAEELHPFGPGTVAWLTYTAEYGRHPFERHGELPFDNAPQWLRKWVPKKWGGLRASSQIDERQSAVLALQILGPEAATAIPALARVFESASEDAYSELSYHVAYAFHAMGPASWRVVEQMLQHAKPHGRMVLLATIYLRLGTADRPAAQAEVAKVVAILGKACCDHDTEVRWGVANGIKSAHFARPDLIALDTLVNELISLLYDSNTYVQLSAMEALGSWNAKAAQAIPRLIELLDDKDGSIRVKAAVTLAHVDTEEKRSAARLRIMSRDDPAADCLKAAADALKALGLSPDDKTAAPEVLSGQ